VGRSFAFALQFVKGLCWPKTPSEVIGRTSGSQITPVVMVQSIEDGNRDEPSSPRPSWRGRDFLRNSLPNPLRWPCSVEVFDSFPDPAMKLPVPDKRDVIEAFSPHAPMVRIHDRSIVHVQSSPIFGRM